jgi:uncharacterized alpha-E superfamily protein
MTRHEFAAAVRALLTPEQWAELVRLHAQLGDDIDGCTAAHEGVACCVDAIAQASGTPSGGQYAAT